MGVAVRVAARDQARRLPANGLARPRGHPAAYQARQSCPLSATLQFVTGWKMTNVQSGAISNLIFLSYRRADTAAQTLALRLELETQLRAASGRGDAIAICRRLRASVQVGGAVPTSEHQRLMPEGSKDQQEQCSNTSHCNQDHWCLHFILG